MTRINCIPVDELTRAHCFAEYREMARLRHLYPRKAMPIIPESYRLGTGHVMFFADKGAYLVKRHKQLHDRLVHHWGYNLNIPVLSLFHWPIRAMCDWIPDDRAMEINRGRINERLKGKGRVL